MCKCKRKKINEDVNEKGINCKICKKKVEKNKEWVNIKKCKKGVDMICDRKWREKMREKKINVWSKKNKLKEKEIGQNKKDQSKGILREKCNGE